MVMSVLAATSCLALDQTLWNWKAGPFLHRIVVWDVADLTEPKLRSYYQRLSRDLKRYGAWTVDVFVDRDDAAREVSGKMLTDKDYDWWLDLYNKFGRKLLPMAEISGFRADAVLRLRDRNGNCSETVLSGDNFPRASVGDVKFEILETLYRWLPPHTKPRPGDDAMIDVYVRASSYPSVEQARTFSRLMQNRLQEKQIILMFRTDAFFIDDAFFPIMYRFDPAATPPTKEAYEHSKIMACEPEIRCGELGK
jgi:hypothetical protein